jgi:hypothetical protein
VLEKPRFGTDVLLVPHLQLPHSSDATIVGLVVVSLIASLVGPVIGTIVVFLFGDRDNALDRSAAWIATSLDDSEGDPIVKPGKEPTLWHKGQAVGHVLAVAAVIVWLLFLRG